MVVSGATSCRNVRGCIAMGPRRAIAVCLPITFPILIWNSRGVSAPMISSISIPATSVLSTCVVSSVACPTPCIWPLGSSSIRSLPKAVTSARASWRILIACLIDGEIRASLTPRWRWGRRRKGKGIRHIDITGRYVMRISLSCHFKGKSIQSDSQYIPGHIIKPQEQ